MNIANISLMVNGRNEGLSKAFRSIATNYAETRPNKDMPYFLHNLPWKPDIVFIQIQDEWIRDGRYKLSTVGLLSQKCQQLKEKGTFIINWTGDKRDQTPQWMIQLSGYVNSTAFSNMEDVNRLKATGNRSDFLQIGIDPEVFKKWPKQKHPEIVFMGNNHGRYPLSGFRMQFVQQIKAFYGSKFSIYGNGYPGISGQLNADGNNPFPMQSRESQVYNSAKIAISISHYNSERYTSDRLLRIMGSYCFPLVHHYKGIEQDFEIGKHLDIFHTIDEAKDKINYYLEHEKEREEIAQNAYDLVHTKHTYKNMVEDIINLTK